MPLKMDDLNWEVDLPELPRSIRLIELEVPGLEKRREAIELFTTLFNLGKLKRVDLANSFMYASKRGEVEFYPNSGGLWARDATAEERYDNEMRNWPDLKRVKPDGDAVWGLPSKVEDRLLEQGRELLESAGLVSEFMQPQGVALEQVTQFNPEGEIMNRGAGTATIQFQYRVDGLPVMGAGAKSQFYADPDQKGTQMVGAFHCWRPASGDHKLDVGTIEEALAAGVLKDPELIQYHKKGRRIVIYTLNFGYLALPAMVSQRFLYPVFQIEGKVHTSGKQEYFEFARYHHAISAEQYRKEEIYADYLMKMN